MPDPLYQVWINDDDELSLKFGREYLESEFPGLLEIRTHEYYGDLVRTVERCMSQQEPESEDSIIYPPNLVIQDYNYGQTLNAPDFCWASLKLITESFPSAKVVIATSSEYFDEARQIAKEKNLDLSVAGKVELDTEAQSIVERIITQGLQKPGYGKPEYHK